MTSIWLVEDDEVIGAGLARVLGAEGYEVTWARSIAEVRSLAGRPDVAIVDRGLPDGDGIDLCAELEAGGTGCRTMLVTARAEEIDVVTGLDAGAVDYIVKPFRLAELLARVRAQLRGSGGDDGAATAQSLGRLFVDPVARRVHVGTDEVILRAKEFDLLSRLAAEPGCAITREALMLDVWGRHWSGETKTLDVHIAAVRRHLERTEAGVSIVTLRGVGYRLEAAP